jgi:hypothetical protein
MRRVVRGILLGASGVFLLVGLFAWILQFAHHDLSSAGWAVAIGGPPLALVLSFAASRFSES